MDVSVSVDAESEDLASESDAAEASSPAAAPSEDSLDIPLTEEEEAPESVAPLGASAAAPPEAKPLPWQQLLRKRPVVLGAAAVAVLLVLVLVFTPTSTATGTLVVTVLDPGGTPVKEAQVLVDGVQRCQVSPCAVEGIEDGVHVVRVSVAGYASATEQKTEVEPGTKTHLSLRLVSEPTAGVDRPIAAADEFESPESSGEEDTEEESETASDGRKRKKAKAKRKRAADESSADEEEAEYEEEAAPKGFGRMVVKSDVPATVYVDGKRWGSAPLEISSLPAGPHTVTVRHPDFGSRTVGVNVKAGKSVPVKVNLSGSE